MLSIVLKISSFGVLKGPQIVPFLGGSDEAPSNFLFGPDLYAIATFTIDQTRGSAYFSCTFLTELSFVGSSQSQHLPPWNSYVSDEWFSRSFHST